MFLLVLVFIFLSAQIMVKNSERIGDEEDGLVVFDDCQYNDGIDTLVGEDTDKDIFFINPGENMMNVETSSSIQNSEIKVRNSLMQSLRLNERVSMQINGWLPEKIIKLS